MTHRPSDEPSRQSNPFRPPGGPEAGRSDPGATEARPERGSIIYLLACLLWCGLAIKMIVLRPILFSLFADFELELPWVTRLLLHPAVSILFVMIAVGLVLRRLTVASIESRRRIGWRALVLALVVILVMAIGFGLPLFSLMRALA
ncbi:hypothetical protein Mal15_62680 [Stieleria maiorica]|uniref:Uncharacterized protein n=1 Tax=Stieleria maiorica TaxID=2795974 RepID=A0A5B9MLL2_9BACT|nr:hypothetical protein Mal15_62680 [Stieleria maiorica]